MFPSFNCFHYQHWFFLIKELPSGSFPLVETLKRHFQLNLIWPSIYLLLNTELSRRPRQVSLIISTPPPLILLHLSNYLQTLPLSRERKGREKSTERALELIRWDPPFLRFWIYSRVANLSPFLWWLEATLLCGGSCNWNGWGAILLTLVQWPVTTTLLYLRDALMLSDRRDKEWNCI